MRKLWRDAAPLRAGARILLRLFPEVDTTRTVVVVAAAVLMAAAQVGIGVVTGVLIARVVQGDPVEGSTLALVVTLPVLLLLVEVGRLVGVTVGQTLKRRVDGALRRRVLALSLGPPGLAHLEDPELLALHGAARNLSPFTFTPGDAAVQMSWGLAVRIQPLLALLVLAWFVPPLAVLALVVWAVAQLYLVAVTLRLVMGAASSMMSPEVVYLRDLVQTGSAAKEIRVFGLSPWFGGRFLDLTRERMLFSLAQREGQVRSYARGGVLLGLGAGGGLLWVGLAGASGHLSVQATAISVFALLNVFFVPNLLPDVPVVFGSFAVQALEQAERAERPGLALPSGPVRPAPVATEGIRFRDVTFRYPGGERPVFAGLDLEVRAGERLAVVGLNGAGKTTLVKLLCRLYDPEQGSVEVDGIDLREVDPAAWRERTGVLFQDFIRYQLPVHDNVELRPVGPSGRGPASTTDVAPTSVEQAAHVAGVLELVEGLPAAWETPLHGAARGGVDLSGGQWQRVALARGLHAVEQGASILVLDEPTANLDPKAELEFFESVLARPLAGDRPITTVLISHRFATVRHADRIVVLEEGHVVEDGTHDALDGPRGSLPRAVRRAGGDVQGARRWLSPTSTHRFPSPGRAIGSGRSAG